MCLAYSSLYDIFRLPMSRAPYNEFLLFQVDLEQFREYNNQEDIWVYQWNHGLYSSRKYCRRHFQSVTPHAPYCWMQKTKCMPKIKFFTWLLLSDRLNRRDLLRRRHNTSKKDIFVYYARKTLMKHCCIFSQSANQVKVDGLLLEYNGARQEMLR